MVKAGTFLTPVRLLARLARKRDKTALVQACFCCGDFSGKQNNSTWDV